MNSVGVKIYNNYIDTHIALGRLQEAGITCWLKDENYGTLIAPLFPYRQEIKLMVTENQITNALQIPATLAEQSGNS